MLKPLRTLLNNINNRLYVEIDQIPGGVIKALPTDLVPFIWFFMRQVKWLLRPERFQSGAEEEGGGASGLQAASDYRMTKSRLQCGDLVVGDGAAVVKGRSRR